jgi:hypothetical protein
MARQPLIQKH